MVGGLLLPNPIGARYLAPIAKKKQFLPIRSNCRNANCVYNHYTRNLLRGGVPPVAEGSFT
jgi:hypothetical protein